MSSGAFSTAHVDPSFKTCSNCGKHWERLEDFLQDPEVGLTGYMPTFDELLTGLFLFNHRCGTTLSCPVVLFEHLYNGPVYRVRKSGTPECPGYCQNKTDFSPCPVKCNCAFVREILLILKRWPKFMDG